MSASSPRSERRGSPRRPPVGTPASPRCDNDRLRPPRPPRPRVAPTRGDAAARRRPSHRCRAPPPPAGEGAPRRDFLCGARARGGSARTVRESVCVCVCVCECLCVCASAHVYFEQRERKAESSKCSHSLWCSQPRVRVCENVCDGRWSCVSHFVVARACGAVSLVMCDVVARRCSKWSTRMCMRMCVGAVMQVAIGT